MITAIAGVLLIIAPFTFLFSVLVGAEWREAALITAGSAALTACVLGGLALVGGGAS